MTTITKTTTGSDGGQVASTYTLAPQITPFAPAGTTTTMPSSCSFSVYCRGLSHAVYSQNTAAHHPHPLDGQRCLAVQAAPQPGLQVGYNEDCWPQDYFVLFDDAWGVLNGAGDYDYALVGDVEEEEEEGDDLDDDDDDGDDGGGDWDWDWDDWGEGESESESEGKNKDDNGQGVADGSMATVAFPGDQCLAGWTTACTTTITAAAAAAHGSGTLVNEESEFPQAWCCPPGQWTCASATAADTDTDTDTNGGRRLCRSIFTPSAPTDIWMYWDPPYEGSTAGEALEAYTWTAGVDAETDPAHAATVFLNVFPLALGGEGAKDVDSYSDSDSGSWTTVFVTATVTPIPEITTTKTKAWGMDWYNTPVWITVTENVTPRLEGRDGGGVSVKPVLVSRGDDDSGAYVSSSNGVVVAAAIVVAIVSLFGLLGLYRWRRGNSGRAAISTCAELHGEGAYGDKKDEEGLLRGR
ncbi:hypothetical protein M426DRAFT_146810 [Hypoxylon sp. CI-4A]|nr:hypothetical protein M426DRAFT_146810 [Hypoxylon sp. CI-4A]